jgi:predicted DCC family thiol-disulfide oxidoreductase YuxK
VVGHESPASESALEVLFYDGGCGLCHRFVRFVLWADGDGDRFLFAPLEGETFRALIPDAQRVLLPDSIVLRLADGSLRTRSAAILHLLRRLGGLCRVFALLLAPVPQTWRDGFYDFVASRRRAWFRPPADVCPAVLAHLRSRFLP